MHDGIDKIRIGVVGCGNISKTYMRNASLFQGIELVACADISFETAQARAIEFGINVLSVDELLAEPNIDLVLNLTVPKAHAEVSTRALSAGKHVFTEKPLATHTTDGKLLVSKANTQGLLLGSAPDTFLGAAGREARRLLDSGAIGRPVTGTAFMFGRGMEHWHPNPAFYYQRGGGPLFDMGPYYLTMLVHLLGPIKTVLSASTQAHKERLITAEGPLHNTSFQVETPTTVQTLLVFESDVIIQFGTSWDVYRHSNANIEIHGTEGSLRLPDPDTFGGVISLSNCGDPWLEYDTEDRIFGVPNWPFEAPDRANYRMLGVAELVQANKECRKPRASGELMLHILEIMESILKASESGDAITINTTTSRPLLFDDSAAAMLLA